jgi:hypothetical protein
MLTAKRVRNGAEHFEVAIDQQGADANVVLPIVEDERRFVLNCAADGAMPVVLAGVAAEKALYQVGQGALLYRYPEAVADIF